jgi:hypothetical protein
MFFKRGAYDKSRKKKKEVLKSETGFTAHIITGFVIRVLTYTSASGLLTSNPELM